MRPLGFSFLPAFDLTAEERAAMLADSGFNTVIVNYSQAQETRQDCDTVRRNGLDIDHVHGPFRGINAMWLPGEEGEQMLERLLDSLDCCRENGVDKMVVHLSSGVNAPAICDLGIARFDRLMEHADRCGVTVAYENQRKLANLAWAMERYPRAGFCWDVGHEICLSGGREYMPLFGDRMVCLHLHDNGALPNGDTHLIAFDGVLDMAKAAAYLKRYAYAGPVTLENFLWLEKQEQRERYGAMTAQAYYRRSYEAAARFRALIDG